MRLVIAAAPGARYTGIIVRDGPDLRHRHLVARADTPIDWYLGEVVDAIQKAKDLTRNLILQNAPHQILSPAVLAIEDSTTTDNPLHPRHELLDVAQVVGAVAGHWPTVRITALPAGQALADYPPMIQARGNDRYLRTAWDTAEAAVEEATA